MPSYRVIGTDWCPFCTKVKAHLETKKADFEWIDSDTAEGTKIRNEEAKKYNYSTIPMVFIDSKFVGGCSEFFAKL